MFVKYSDDCIRLEGRWAKFEDKAVTTTTGSRIFLKFEGDMALLKFDLTGDTGEHAHIWISIDSENMAEAALGSALRIKTAAYGVHTVRIIYKSQIETRNRWKEPLEQKLTFLGAEIEKPVTIEADTRKTIEFVGDSITEGVLTDANADPERLPEENTEFRVYQDDVCATYGWQTAEKLNLSPIIMGYGAVGTRKGGNGNVPCAAEAYPYNFDGNPICHQNADYIVINHGANDASAPAEDYIAGYEKLLDVIRKLNPNAKIFALSAFCGAHAEALGKFINEYNGKKGENITFIDSTGWIPKEPLHPLRGGHEIVAENLSRALKEYIK